MDYQTKRDMIMRAYKWRDDNKKKTEEEFYAQTLLLFMYIITLSHFYNMNNNYNLIFECNEKCSDSK